MDHIKQLCDVSKSYLPASIQTSSSQLKSIVCGIGGILLVVFSSKQVYKFYRIRLNNQKRERKRANKESSIQRTRAKCKNLKPNEVDDIVNLSLAELRNAIKSGQLNSMKVLRAYQAKSLEAHDKTNCITEYITEAEKWAEEADSSDGDGKLLHGIPISIKDDVPLKGYDCTLGLIDLCEVPMELHSTMVQMLRRHGAIPFCKTNIPQFELAFESSNPIFGVTCNPHDTTRGSGGSSGGESALIAAGGSILGIGSDIGGSIRNPSNFTGLCGFKPTTERQSLLGHELVGGEPDLVLENVLEPSWGPLARDMESVILTSRILLDGKAVNKIDPMMAPLPFNIKALEDPRPLRIGYYDDNGLLETVPAVKRAVLQAKKYLESRGHTLVKWLPPDMGPTVRLEIQALFANGAEELFPSVAYEKTDKCVEKLFRGKSLPRWLQLLYAKLIARKDPMGAEFIEERFQRKTDKYWQICAKFRQSRRKALEAWREMKLDAIICPAGAFPAPPLNSADLLISTASYLMVYNVLNFPAGVVRMTSVTEKDNQKMKYYPENEQENMYHKKIKKAMEGSVGLPVGVQVVTPWYEDELCLRVMKEVEGAADFHVMNKK